MLAMVKRNMMLYFRNRSGVIFSLLGALISFVLYLVFLKKGFHLIGRALVIKINC